MKKKILPHQVVDAFDSSDLVPIQNGFLRYDPILQSWCGCALMAIFLSYVQKTPEQMFDITKTDYFDDDTIYLGIVYPKLRQQFMLEADYLRGFVEGFDDPKLAPLMDDWSDQYTEGYLDGHASFQAVREKKGVMV